MGKKAEPETNDVQRLLAEIQEQERRDQESAKERDARLRWQETHGK